MEVFSKYFTRLVASNAAQIFGLTRPTANPGNYSLLVEEMRKISHDVGQASKVVEAIESGTDDIFRDFDLSTFMEHFKLDALEKTILALAFKMGNKSDLKTKGLSASRPTFLAIADNTYHSGCYSFDELPHFREHHCTARLGGACGSRRLVCCSHRRPLHPVPATQFQCRIES